MLREYIKQSGYLLKFDLCSSYYHIETSALEALCAYIGPHFMLLLSIYVLYSNVTYIYPVLCLVEIKIVIFHEQQTYLGFEWALSAHTSYFKFPFYLLAYHQLVTYL